MPNEGPIKYSLQRQRPLGREKPPYPTRCHNHHRDSFYEQNILKVNSRGSLKNTHSAPNECSIFDFFPPFSFFCHFHAWAPGFPWKPYGNGREKGEITPQIQVQNPNGCTVNLIEEGDGIRCRAGGRET